MKSGTDSLVTADEVDNKKFNTTKFRPGYDQDEVDDFLDKVARTLRYLEHKYSIGDRNFEWKATGYEEF